MRILSGEKKVIGCVKNTVTGYKKVNNAVSVNMEKIAQNLFTKRLSCPHRDFEVATKDHRVREIPPSAHVIHSCADITVAQQGIERFYQYETLEATASCIADTDKSSWGVTR